MKMPAKDLSALQFLLLGVLFSPTVASKMQQQQGRPQVGMMYEGWHAHAYFGKGESRLTLEDVVRSNGTLALSDMAPDSTADGFYWHVEPEDGFYCIYRKRSNESEGCLPDCPNITGTLMRHANMLTGAGVDFVVADSTNFFVTGDDADCFQLRPFEVLAEEWLNLRMAGVSTPRIAIWQNIQDPSGDLWEAYLSTYENPEYEDLIFKDEATGRKVFFATANPDPTIVAKLEAMNYAVVSMWAEHMDAFEAGEWTFFSPCIDAVTGAFTTSVSSFATGARCAQKMTTNAPIGATGTSLTVSPSWQASYSSLPFQAAGKLGGLTMKRQFETAFDAIRSAANGSGPVLDYLFVATFNEHIAQPQPNPYYPDRPAAVSEGLPNDPQGSSLWVDMFGDARSRDLEPNTADGGAAWALFESCMRVLDATVEQTAARARGNSSSDNDPCAAMVGQEPCCDLGETDPASAWNTAWSLQRTVSAGSNGGGSGEQRVDSLVTTTLLEKDTLLAGGDGWSEICAPFGGNGDFCGGTQSEDFSDDRRGPFLLFAQEQLPTNHTATTTTTTTATTSAALYRCYDAEAQHHFMSRNATCALVPSGTAEAPLGFVSLARTSATPRSLFLCLAAVAGDYFYHSLDGPCDDGDTFMEDCGFVH